MVKLLLNNFFYLPLFQDYVFQVYHSFAFSLLLVLFSHSHKSIRRRSGNDMELKKKYRKV